MNTGKVCNFPARWNQTVSSLNDRWARRPSTYIMLCKTDRRREWERDGEIPGARDFGLNNFMRGWTLWELPQTDRGAGLFSAPVGWYFSLLRLPRCLFFFFFFSGWNTSLGQTPCAFPLPFFPSVLHGALLTQSADLGTLTCQTLVEQLPQRPSFFNTTVSFFFSFFFCVKGFI